MRRRTSSHTIGLVITLGSAVTACGSEELFEPDQRHDRGTMAGSTAAVSSAGAMARAPGGRSAIGREVTTKVERIQPGDAAVRCRDVAIDADRRIVDRA